MSLVSTAEVKARIKTTLGETDLQDVIDQVEAEIIGRYGAHYVNGTTTVTETLDGGLGSLYLRRPLTSITSIVEDDVTLIADDYRLWAERGQIERLSAGTKWGAAITIVYLPADDNRRRASVIIDLVRLALERTAMGSESVGGEYSYTALDWGAEEAAILRRLKMGL